MCDQIFSEAHALGLCSLTSVDEEWEDTHGGGYFPPAYLKLRGTARVRHTSGRTTEVDHADGRVSATVRPATFHSAVSMNTGKETDR